MYHYLESLYANKKTPTRHVVLVLQPLPRFSVPAAVGANPTRPMIAGILAKGPGVVEVVANVIMCFWTGSQPLARIVAPIVGKGTVHAIITIVSTAATTFRA